LNPSQVAPLPTHTRPTRPKSKVALCRLGRPTLIFGFLANTEATSRGDNPENHESKNMAIQRLHKKIHFHLICHLILTKINCITLKIHSKADFKSKSQNIWQQIILFSCTVMQMICTWHKIWTLSGRLSLMHNVQLMKKENIYIPCVSHKNNWKRKIGSHDMKFQKWMNARYSLMVSS
jgi:hypothetical protein